MKIKFKPNDKKTKNSLEGYKGISPYGTMLYKYNLNIFNKLYKDISKNNLKDLIRLTKEFYNTDKSPADYINDALDILPASGHDICNYLARHGMANFQIQAIMKLDGRLDFDKLKRAVRLSVDAEPVLGCRFVEDDPPYWKRMDNLDEVSFCSLIETDNSDEAVNRFLQSPLGMDSDPNVKVTLIRSEQYDVLGVKVNHACSDGAGTKEYLHLLSEIYSNIDQENGTFIPKPRIGGRKDQDKLFKELGIKYPELKWNPLAGSPKTMWVFPWKHRGRNSIRFVICRLPQENLEAIRQYGKSRGATVHDLILTAFYRTMFKISKPLYGIPMDISSTIDLRRYLPEGKTEAIRNFSGGFITKIARYMDESFDGTLERVKNATKKIKNRYPGLNNAMGGEYIEKASFTIFNNYFELMSQISEISANNPSYIINICYPGLSNLGYISDSLIRFGENTVTDAYIIPPAVRAPGFLLLAGSYNGILTLSTSYYKGSILKKVMESFLAMVKNELMRGCTYEK